MALVYLNYSGGSSCNVIKDRISLTFVSGDMDLCEVVCVLARNAAFVF